jgi:predicted porin
VKKSQVALAALGLFIAGAASAQSSVTIYGNLDLGVSKINKGTSFLNGLPVGLTGTQGTWNIRPSSSNRIGFRGTEDMGGGLKANFAIEHRLDPSQGTEQNGQNGFWRGHSWVGVSGAMGEIRLGRDYNPALFVAQRGDPWLWDYNVGSVQVINRAGNGQTYSSNAIMYLSPSIAGFTTYVQLGLGEGGTAVNAANNTDRTFGANVQYSAGPLYAGFAINDVRIQNSPNQNRFWVLTLNYDLGFVKPIVQYASAKNVSTETSKSFVLGATAPIGAGTLKAVVARLDPAGANNSTTKVGLGYEYWLSKRTSIHADVGSGKTDNQSRTTGFESGMKHVF